MLWAPLVGPGTRSFQALAFGACWLALAHMVFRPFQWTSETGAVWGGICDEEGIAEWEWSRVQHSLSIHSADHSFLARNKKSFERQFELAEAS